LLTKNTREKDMFEKASKKLGLDRAILNQDNSDKIEFSTKKDTTQKMGLDKNEIDTLLKYGAYQAFKEDGEEEKMLEEENIDSILERNATIVVYKNDEVKEVEKQSEKGLSKFAKATFCFESQNEENVDVNDKDFWRKILPEQKDAEGLLKRMTQMDVKDEKLVEEFFRDVEDLVNSQLVDTGGKKLNHRYQTDEALEDLLAQIINSKIFTEGRKKLARLWLRQIRPKRNNRESKDEEEDEIVEVEEIKESEKDDKKSLKKDGWYKSERIRFQKGLLEHGWGKWSTLRNLYKLNLHTEQEIESFAENFLLKFTTLLEDEKQKEFVKSIIFSNSSEDAGYEDKEKNELKISIDGSIKTIQNFSVTIPENLVKESVNLIEIVHLEKDNIKCIRMIEIDANEMNNKKIILVSPGIEGEYFIRFVSIPEKPDEKEPEKKYMYQSKKFKIIKNTTQSWIKKLEFSNDMKQIFKDNTEIKKKDFPPLSIKLRNLTSWWEPDFDRELLNAVYKYGYGRSNDFKEYKDLEFVKKYMVSHEKEKEDSWPTVAGFNKRVNYLLNKLKDFYDPSAEKPKQTIITEFSKREKGDLQRTILNYGLFPDK
jgi:hypothetical protein